MIRTSWMVAAVLAVACCTCHQTQTPSEFDLDEPNEPGEDASDSKSTTDPSEDSAAAAGIPSEDCPDEQEAAPDPIDWATDPEEPADIHPKAKRHDPGAFEWAPDDREVVLHTYAESEATKSEWAPLVEHLDDDRGEEIRPNCVAPRRAFGLVVQAPLHLDEDPNLEQFRTERGKELEPGQTLFWGLGGPFARHRLHLFECGPGQSGNTPTRAWRVGNTVVRCENKEDSPFLEYGIGLDPTSKPAWKTTFKKSQRKELVEASTSSHAERVLRSTQYLALFSGEPSVVRPYLDWWRRVKDADLHAWDSWSSMKHRDGFWGFDPSKLSRLNSYVFDEFAGSRSSRLAFLNLDFLAVSRYDRFTGRYKYLEKKCSKALDVEERAKDVSVRGRCWISFPGPNVYVRPEGMGWSFFDGNYPL